MEHARIKAVSETDVDEIITRAGGSRLSQEGSADYVLNEAVVELKLIVEEGFEKESRRAKLAELFRQQQPDSPVVVMNPKTLNSTASRLYYNIVAGPIKTHVKKAASQLEATAARSTPPRVRVLIILNIGYSALNHDEFKSICVKCAQNDTTKIDWLVCGGIYYYSDRFDNYVAADFEDVAINIGRPFPSFKVLLQSWSKFIDQTMTDMMRSPDPREDGKMPVLDLAFEVNGIRYVKPSPTMPKSGFWPGGKPPRINSSGIETCPAAAVTFPFFTQTDWEQFRRALPSARCLQSSYSDWLLFQKEQDEEHADPLKPLVFVPVKCEDFLAAHSQTHPSSLTFTEVCRLTAPKFEAKLKELIFAAQDLERVAVRPLEYVFLVVKEVGRDKINDLCSIYFVSQLPGFEREENLVKDENIFFEYGLALAAAWAIKRNIEYVLFTNR